VQDDTNTNTTNYHYQHTTGGCDKFVATSSCKTVVLRGRNAASVAGQPHLWRYRRRALYRGTCNQHSLIRGFAAQGSATDPMKWAQYATAYMFGLAEDFGPARIFAAQRQRFFAILPGQCTDWQRQ
jgi:hypothetical protein